MTEDELYLREGTDIKKFDLIVIDEFEVRISQHSLHKLHLIVKKLSCSRRFSRKMGRPEEISEYAEN